LLDLMMLNVLVACIWKEPNDPKKLRMDCRMQNVSWVTILKVSDWGGRAVCHLFLKKSSTNKQSQGTYISPSCNLLQPVLFRAKISKPARWEKWKPKLGSSHGKRLGFVLVLITGFNQCFLWDEFSLFFALKIWFRPAKRVFVIKMALICQIIECFFITRFLQQVPVGSQNIKIFVNFLTLISNL
jgi:hypothetical protein